MNLIKSFALAASFVILGGTAANVRAEGYNQVNISYVNNSFSYGGAISTDAYKLNGLGIEYLRGFGVSKSLPMFVEGGLNFNFAFGEVLDKPASHIGMAIPVSFAYKFNIKDVFTIKPYAGIDFNIGLVGKNRLSNDGDEEAEWNNWYDTDEDSHWSRFNLGWHIGADFQYSHFIVGLKFTSDITKVYKNELTHVNNNVIAVKLGYTF